MRGDSEPSTAVRSTLTDPDPGVVTHKRVLRCWDSPAFPSVVDTLACRHLSHAMCHPYRRLSVGNLITWRRQTGRRVRDSRGRRLLGGGQHPSAGIPAGALAEVHD
jgi:hypothetical protein